ncbi:MAG: transglycosylase SLT domain-containing protein [Colwellia sp.]|nr:transglycosylase SLT domain-containing protein [Colwellia sp.]
MNYVKSLIGLALFTILIVNVNAEALEEVNNFADFRKKHQNKYQTFKSNYLKRYESYREKVKAQWGVAELSSQTEFIQYNDVNKTKVIANFETDTIEVSINDAENLNQKQLNQLVNKAIVDALAMPSNNIVSTEPEPNAIIDVDNIVNPSTKTQQTSDLASPTSVLMSLGIESKNQLAELVNNSELISPKLQQQLIVTRTTQRLENQISQLENFTSRESINEQQLARSKALVVSMKTERQGIKNDAQALTQKNIKTYKISLHRDRFNKAKEFLDIVEKNANKWQVSRPMILAIIETESHFNPLAKSYVPAYGLMQIVPSTAGSDVNNKLFGLTNKPTPQLLYSSADNIKYGSAYLHILLTRYLKEIENPTSRLYCAIASYNTGIGNLAKAFNGGKRGRLKAIEKINSLTPEQVYQVIKKRTHSETQRYLDKVLKSKQYFSDQEVKT